MHTLTYTLLPFCLASQTSCGPAIMEYRAPIRFDLGILGSGDPNRSVCHCNPDRWKGAVGLAYENHPNSKTTPSWPIDSPSSRGPLKQPRSSDEAAMGSEPSPPTTTESGQELTC
ncbi:hypothetical protein BDW71DRAFT_179501 [Aspergillus fruticulosus]